MANVHITSGDHTGDIGTIVEGGTGPVVLNGNHYENATVKTGSDTNDSRDGATVIKGVHHGGISRSF